MCTQWLNWWNVKVLSSSFSGGPEAPTDLVTSEVTHYSFRATWNGPEGPVEKYRIEYSPVTGGETQQVLYSSPVKIVCKSTLLRCFYYWMNLSTSERKEPWESFQKHSLTQSCLASRGWHQCKETSKSTLDPADSLYVHSVSALNGA